MSDSGAIPEATRLVAQPGAAGLQVIPSSARAASGTPSPVRVFTAVAWFEWRMAARSRWVLVTAAAFFAASLAVSWLGLFGAGYLEFQGFERTAISLLSLALYVSPLLGSIIGLDSFGGGDDSDLLLLEPARAGAVVLGKLAGATTAVTAALLLGFGGAGLVIAARTGAEGITGYLVLVGASAALAAAFTGLAALAALLARDRLQASGAAVGAWLWFVLLYELVLLGLLVLVPEVAARQLLVAGLFGSPVSLSRVVVLVALGVEPVLGAGGALLLRTFGEGGAIAVLLLGLVAWIAGPWTAATLVGARRRTS